MASVRQIALQVGVSPATVSRVMNNDPGVSGSLRNRVLAAANKTRYLPRVGRRSTTNIAFLYTGDSSLGSPFDAALMQGMSERMDELGFDLMILSARRAMLPGETFSQMFLRKGIRGAVLRTSAQCRVTCQQIAAEGFPAVVVGERFDDPKVNFIYADSRGASTEAVEHLIGLGHRQIAIATNVVDTSDHLDRLEAYRHAMVTHGLEINPRWHLRVPARLDGGVQLALRLRSMPDRPTAIFITDPMTAVGAINECHRMGMAIPRDLSIVGFDDGETRHLMRPTMTAVCQNAPEIGREAFEALHLIIESKTSNQGLRRALQTQFEIGGSTAELLDRRDRNL